MQELEKAGVPLSIGENIAEYEIDRVFVNTLKKYRKSLLDIPSDCLLSNTFKQYDSVIGKYANAIQKKWIITGNALEKITDNKTIFDTFDSIVEDISARLNSICEACHMKHEHEKK